MAYTLAQLQTFFTNANAGFAPTTAQNNGLVGIYNQNSAGSLTDAQALQSAIDLGSDASTAVLVETYQFYLGYAPSQDGLKALNAAYNGTGTQANLNGENRFIAQSVALALDNPAAKTAFSNAYAGSVVDATKQAYNVIVGTTAAAAAGINVDAAVAFLTSTQSLAYYEAFVKANRPGISAADLQIAVKAALVGEIMYQATVFNNGAGVGSYAVAANNLVKDLADDGALTANNASGIPLFDNYGVSPVAQTLTLTTGADTLNGGAGADTFVATNTTLSAADSLTGGAGVDTLNYASNGTVAVNQAGFKAAGIENYNITSDAGSVGNVAGTTFDMSGVTGATRIVNDDSSFDLTLTGLNEAATIVVRNTSQSIATVNTTVNYNATVVAGNSTVQALVLENVFDPGSATPASKSAVTINGVETFNVTGQGTVGSYLTALNSNTLTNVNIDGGQSVRIDNLTFNTVNGAASVDGSKNTAGINVTLSNSGAVDVTVKGGAGADRADFSNGFAAKDSFDGGAGIDTIVLSQAVASGTLGGTLTAVEVLEVSGGGTGAVDLSKFASVDTVNYTSTGQANGNSLVGATTITNARATLTVSQDAGTVGNTLGVALATDGSADSLTLNVNKVGTADTIGAITAAQWDTIRLNLSDDATVAGQGNLTSAGLTAANVKSITVTSDVNATFTGAVGGAALTSFDASAATGKLDFTATQITTALTGATIKLGSGNDRLVVNATSGTATGGDTITLGAGADTVIYTALSQSTDKTTDTITDFVSGTDKLDLTGLNLTSGTQFVGVRATFALAQGALTTAIDGVQAVFQADTNTLWLDLDSNGQLDQSDFRVVLTGVTTITAGDLSLGLTGNSITLNALAANVSLTSQVGATGVLTNDNDTVTTTIANLNGATSVNAGAGANDTLVISDAGTVTIPATFVGFDSLTLANGTNTVSAAAATTVKNITGGTGADTVSLTNFTTGGAVSLGGGADTVNNATKAFVEATGATFDGGTSSTSNVVDNDTFNVANTGLTAGTTLNLTSVSNFETVVVAAGAGALTVQGATANSDGLGSGITALTMDSSNGNITLNTTLAKIAALNSTTGINNAGGANSLNVALTTAGSLDLTNVAVSARVAITGASTGNTTFTANSLVKANAVNGNAATTGDVLNITADLVAGGAQTLSGASLETVNVNAAQTIGNALTFAAGTTTVNSAFTGQFTLGGAATFNGTGTTAQTINAANAATTANLSSTGASTYNGGSAADTINVTGAGNGTIGGGDGANTLNHSSSGAVTYNGGINVDTATLSGTGALTFNGGDGNDTVTVTGTGALTFTGGNGVDTVTLNATGTTVDTIVFSDGGAGVGINAAANRDVITNFNVNNDKIQLDTAQTTVGTAAAAQPVLQVVGTAGAFTASNTADVTVLNFDLGGTTAVIGVGTDGTALIANTGAITIAANQVGYILAYDNGNAYLYAFTDANADTSLTANEIALIGTFNGVAVGGLGAANFTLAA